MTTNSKGRLKINRMRIYYYILSISLAFFLFVGCGDDTTPEPIPVPDTFALIYPADNSACVKGDSETDLNSLLEFTWEKALNATDYILEVHDLGTGQIFTFTTTNTFYSASLPANSHYSWEVTAVNSEGETASTLWKFYLAGKPETNYAPFPAELTSPAFDSELNANGMTAVSVTLSWIGSDVDDDIDTYTLFLDKADASTQIGVQTENSAEIELQSGETYYWKVVTKDKAGNSSVSELSRFRILPAS